MHLKHKFPNLDPETINILSEMTGGEPLDITGVPIEEARIMATSYLSFVGASWIPPQCSTKPMEIEGVVSGILIQPELRIEADAPLVIWFHGGGWVFGSAALHEPYGREFASRSKCIIADVEYPLSPGTIGQHQIDYCVRTSREIITKYGQSAGGLFGWGKVKRPVVVGGESAGATLALFVAKELGKGLVDKVVVANPLVDFRETTEYASRLGCTDERIMQTWPEFEWFIDQFAPPSQRSALSIITHASSAFPETTVLLGEYDLLFDEGVSLAVAIRNAGGLCKARIIQGAIHNSIEFGPVTPAGTSFFDAIAEEIRSVGPDWTRFPDPLSSMFIR